MIAALVSSYGLFADASSIIQYLAANSLWSANAGVKAIFDALSIAYGDDEKRSFLALNAHASERGDRTPDRP